MAAYDDSAPYEYGSSNSNKTKSSHVTTNSSSGIFATNAIKEGWAQKKGPQTFAGWKKRFDLYFLHIFLRYFLFT